MRARIKDILFICVIIVSLAEIGCDGVIGSTKKLDKCGVCGGDDSTCHIIEGLYTRSKLPFGYNLIASIPEGACHINITELKPSNNYLAVQVGDGSYIINGNWALGYSNDYLGAGTIFKYHRPAPGDMTDKEYVIAQGPINDTVDIMLLTQTDNHGVMYAYTIPMEKSSQSHSANPAAENQAESRGYKQINTYAPYPGNSYTKKQNTTRSSHTPEEPHSNSLTYKEQPKYVQPEKGNSNQQFQALEGQGDRSSQRSKYKTNYGYQRDQQNEKSNDDNERYRRYQERRRKYYARLRAQQGGQGQQNTQSDESKTDSSPSKSSSRDVPANYGTRFSSSNRQKTVVNNRGYTSGNRAPSGNPSYQAPPSPTGQGQPTPLQKTPVTANQNSGQYSYARKPSNSQNQRRNPASANQDRRQYSYTGQRVNSANQRTLQSGSSNQNSGQYTYSKQTSNVANQRTAQSGLPSQITGQDINPNSPQPASPLTGPSVEGDDNPVQPAQPPASGTKVDRSQYGPRISSARTSSRASPQTSPYYGSNNQGQQGYNYGVADPGTPQRASGVSPYVRFAPAPQQPVYIPATQYGNQNLQVNPNVYNSIYGNRAYGSDGNNVRLGTLDTSATYSWKITGFTDCSRACGGGTRESVIACVLVASQAIVTDENCDTASRPQTQSVTCNNQQCAPGWEVSEWTPCTSSCGRGTQTRSVECKQRVSVTLTLSVSATRCQEIPRPDTVRICNEDKPCVKWRVGEWSQCSADCGQGQRSREVVCVDANDNPVPDNKCDTTRPRSSEVCDLGSCAKTWFFTQWTQQCTSSCGEGFHTRHVYCSAERERCSRINRPDDSKLCPDQPPCGGRWFTGPWGECSSTCGPGQVTRDVLCMKSIGRAISVVGNENCHLIEKPEQTMECESEACQPEWYMTEWSQCSRPCGTGSQTREIKCLNPDQTVSTSCREEQRPLTRQSCNQQSCRAFYNPQPEISSGCTDEYQNCALVVQARLCRYKYYKGICCKSCTKFQIEHPGEGES